jgi:Nif-specific regulatory protein
VAKAFHAIHPLPLKNRGLTATNEAMARCLRLAALAAKSDVPVVLPGETGTGKTLLSHAIHNSPARAARPFVSFNAFPMTDTLLESQLFGHERGAFTGAQQMVKGKFELADSGTLFLDEVPERCDVSLISVYSHQPKQIERRMPCQKKRKTNDQQSKCAI